MDMCFRNKITKYPKKIWVTTPTSVLINYLENLHGSANRKPLILGKDNKSIDKIESCFFNSTAESFWVKKLGSIMSNRKSQIIAAYSTEKFVSLK